MIHGASTAVITNDLCAPPSGIEAQHANWISCGTGSAKARAWESLRKLSKGVRRRRWKH